VVEDSATPEVLSPYDASSEISGNLSAVSTTASGSKVSNPSATDTLSTVDERDYERHDNDVPVEELEQALTQLRAHWDAALFSDLIRLLSIRKRQVTECYIGPARTQMSRRGAAIHADLDVDVCVESKKGRLPWVVEEVCVNYMMYMEALMTKSSGATVNLSTTWGAALGDRCACVDATLCADSIAFPERLSSQLKRIQRLCIFWLGCGALSISNVIACFVLFWVEVWGTSAAEPGTLLAVGEALALVMLLGTSVRMKKNIRKQTAELGLPGVATPSVGASGTVSKICDALQEKTMDQPYLQMWATLLILYSAAILGFWIPSAEDVAERQGPGFTYSFHLSAGLCAIIGNSFLHSSGCENIVRYMPADMFLDTVRWGYTCKRLTNVAQGVLATGLYAIAPQAPFLSVLAFYGLVYGPSQVYGFALDLKALPHQRARQSEDLAEAIVTYCREQLVILEKRVQEESLANSQLVEEQLRKVARDAVDRFRFSNIHDLQHRNNDVLAIPAC
jgi:hypothetical protein